jgi:hypothetical protein
VSVLASVASVLRGKNPQGVPLVWNLCVVILQAEHADAVAVADRRQGALSQWVRRKLGGRGGDSAGAAVELLESTDDPSQQVRVRVSVCRPDAAASDDDESESDGFASVVRACSALLVVLEQPGHQRDGLEFRSTIATQWRRVTACLGPATQVPVALLHDWPDQPGLQPAILDFSRLLCPNGAWPPSLQEGLHVRALDLRRSGRPAIALDECIRLCATRTWSLHQTREQQMSVADLFEAAVARNESLQRFFR